ncbi:MAG: hypothetical protein RL514_1595 [Verrucomicrobiota bacterium]
MMHYELTNSRADVARSGLRKWCAERLLSLELGFWFL